MKATFYVWFDYQALQLCFNILSSEHKKLPFSCTVHVIDSIDPLLKAFLSVARENLLYGNYLGVSNIIEVDGNNHLEDDVKDPKDYILDVWVVTLPCNEGIE